MWNGMSVAHYGLMDRLTSQGLEFEFIDRNKHDFQHDVNSRYIILSYLNLTFIFNFIPEVLVI